VPDITWQAQPTLSIPVGAETVCTGPRQKLDFLRIFNCLTANTFTFGSQNSTGQTPAASRFSIVRPSVSTICHLCPESQLEGYPGSRIKISDSTYQIHTDCDTYTTKNLGHVINEVWGPYKETLGGQLPQNLETLVISYRYSCDANYSNCANKEEFHVAKPYGLVKWQHQSLGSDGTYKPPDNVTYFNRVVSGQTSPVTSCF